MRIALISDVHGNLPALKATLDDIRAQGADQVIFLGDAATLGPYPRETLEVLRSLSCICIQGNHDAALLDPVRAADLQIAPPLMPTLEWGRNLLSEADFDFLRTFRPTYELDLGHNLTMLCFHGSPLSNTDLILSTTADDVLDGFFAGQSANILAGGHAHIQMMRQRGQQVILNTGSVGNAFSKPFAPGGGAPTLLPWAEYALVRVEKSRWSAALCRVRFDAQAVHRAVTERKNPSKEWWLLQYR
jgi:predicted phosphodiesterase